MDPLQHLPGYALRRASSAMMAEFTRRLAPHDLKFSEASLLMLVEVNPGITQSEIGRILDIQRANMTPMTAGLDARGLILRVPVDGRSQGLALSADGLALCAKVKDVVAVHEASLVARIPPEHREHLVPALKALWGPGA